MSRFFVGQRVRVVAVGCKEWKFAVGMETRIVSDDGEFWNLDLTPPAGCKAVVEKDEAWKFLSPILDPGHRACDDQFKRDLDKLLEGLPA